VAPDGAADPVLGATTVGGGVDVEFPSAIVGVLTGDIVAPGLVPAEVGLFTGVALACGPLLEAWLSVGAIVSVLFVPVVSTSTGAGVRPWMPFDEGSGLGVLLGAVVDEASGAEFGPFAVAGGSVTG